MTLNVYIYIYIYIYIYNIYVYNIYIFHLSITLFCTIKRMQKYTINLAIIINATIGIKTIT